MDCRVDCVTLNDFGELLNFGVVVCYVCCLLCWFVVLVALAVYFRCFWLWLRFVVTGDLVVVCCFWFELWAAS